MDDSYKHLECYKHMPEHDKICFDQLVTHYSPFLGNGKTENATATRFTLHDFEHHCYDLFKYISEVILSESAYEKGGLSSRELYVLNLSVLFHDISLHLVDDCERQKHARQSAEWLREEYENPGTTFSDVCELVETELDALCAIIEAHSDERNTNEKTGIKSPELKNYPSKQKPIRTKLLAGILRLADELDISVLRIGDRRFENQLKNLSKEYTQACNLYQTTIDAEIKINAQKEMERLKPSAESYKHWKKLHYFEDVTRINSIIILKGNERRIRQEIAQGNEEVVENIVGDVYLKISKEFLNIQKHLFRPIDGNRAIVAVDKVEIQGVEEQLKRRLETEYQRIKNEIENEVENSGDHEANRLKGTEVLEKTIYDFVEGRKLLQPGHYIMNNKYCASNWIDTQTVLENIDIYRACIDSFLVHMKKMDISNTLLIGLDLQGALMASAIGFILGVPFTYIIPVHKKNQNSERDSRLSFEEEKSIILFTDVIVTAQSIDEACETYHIQKNCIQAIYTVFYRPIRKNIEVDTLASKYAKLIYYINDRYGVNLMKREECERNRPEKCLACNKQIDLGGNGI